MKRKNQGADSVWPQYEYQLGIGAYGGTDDRFRRRKKKNPIGFAPPARKKPKK